MYGICNGKLTVLVTGKTRCTYQFRYSSYSGGDFEVPPAERHAAPMGVKFGVEVNSCTSTVIHIGSRNSYGTPKTESFT